MLTFRTHWNGFTNADLRLLTAQLRGLDPDTVTAGQTTYDLCRLRTHHLIERVPHSHRYRVTDTGLHTAMLITRVHDRLLPTALAQQHDLQGSHQLRSAATAYQHASTPSPPNTDSPPNNRIRLKIPASPDPAL